MSFEEFTQRVIKQNPIFSSQISYLLTVKDSLLSYIRDLNLLMAAEVEGESVKLGFLDLRKRVVVDVGECSDVETATTLVNEMSNIPWPGMSTTYAISIYPINCSDGIAQGFLAVKINTTRDKTFFNWGKIADIILRNSAEEYLQHLNEKYRVLDAVEVV